ncbi:MAG: hypothetical protein WD069_05210 [Planctomycetales bacterium]
MEPARRRQGSTLVVVAALLALLAVLGYMMFRMTSQELESATYFSEGAKELQTASVDPDVYFGLALEQFINGPTAAYPNSALYGGRGSMLATLVGRDGKPYNGVGILLMTSGGLPRVDQNRDGAPDGNQSLLEINDSAAANGGAPRDISSHPEPDADYTAPDINSPFLAFVGYTVDDKGKPVFVVIPSFHRPQYLRTSVGPQFKPYLDPHSDPATVAKMLAPHVEHLDGATGVRRFISPSEPLPAGATGPYPFRRYNQGAYGMRTWTQNTAYGVDEWVVRPDPDSNGWFYRCVTAGTSGGSDPAWSTTDGVTFADGGVTWETRKQPVPEYDADPSGGGSKDSVYVDLDLPVQQLGSGQKYIPLVAFKVVDADGLANLNAHGRLNGNVTVGSNPFGGGNFVHLSHMGLAPAEINLLWLLTAHPGNDLKAGDVPAEVFEDLIAYFGHQPSAASFVEAANMEAFLLKVGRFKTSGGAPVDVFDGVFGELARFQSATNPSEFPFPGRSQFDDNNNRTYGDAPATASVRPFGSPLDWLAAGSAYDATGKFRRFYGPANNLNRWPQFVSVATRGNYDYANLLSGQLMVDSGGAPIAASEPLIDDPEELEQDRRFADATIDRLLEVSEMFFLAASNTDYFNVGASSRLEKLLNWNFSRNARAKEIRQQFTTISHDAQAYGMHRPAAGAAAKFRPWEFTAVAGTNFVGDTRYRFPPNFSNANLATQPFRPALRAWLEQFAGDIDSAPNALEQRAYSLNHFLDDSTGSLVLRGLTEHHPDPGTRAIHQLATGSMTAAEKQEHDARRERQLMARDLYVMLYTFCGGENTNVTTTANTITGPDSSNPGKSLRAVYDDVQLEQMAQFAINAVNRLDRDLVIDGFEYDKDLSDGWNLDDDPYTDDGFADRGHVYGVEEQDLTLSEAMVYRFKQFNDPMSGNPTDHRVTQFDDTQDRYFSFAEIRNNAARPVSLRGNVRLEVETTDGMPGGDTWIRRLTLLSDDPAFPAANRPIPPGELFTVLNAGDDQNRDPMTNVPLPSHVMVDFDLPANLMNPGMPVYDDRLAPLPKGPATLGPTTLGRRVDLIVDDGVNPPRFLLEGEKNGTPEPVPVGGLLNAANIGGIKDSGGGTVKLRLYRRAHADRTVPGGAVPASYDLDNPWIEVDQFTVEINKGYGEIQITMKDDDANIIQHVKEELIKAKSRERIEPLARTGSPLYGLNAEPEYPYTPPPSVPNPNPPPATVNPDTISPNHNLVKLNTIGADNKRSGDPTVDKFKLWQLPGDRDFTSSVELLSVPLYGPADLTKALDPRGLDPRVLPPLEPPKPNRATLAEHLLLRPRVIGAYGADGKPGDTGVDDDGNGVIDDPGERGTGDDPVTAQFARKQDNRWHRLLGFVDVPIRNTPIERFRNSGRVNLNMLRHPEMLAAMLDDPAAFNLGAFNPLRPDADPNATDGKQTTYLVDKFEDGGSGAARDWWVEFIHARDDLDFLTNAYLPGMAHARPFRDFSWLADDVESLEHTLLRRLPLDAPLEPSQGGNLNPDEVQRRLFELGTQAERYGSDLNDLADGGAVDHHTRHRLSSKLANYSTTRSNVFHVFIEVAFFEVVDDPSGAERIGAPIATLPSRRAFFVVDRSLALEKLKKEDFRPAGDPAGVSIKTQAEGGFDWRELVLHSQLIK